MRTEDRSLEDPFWSGRALGLNHIKLAVWLFIASEVMFFGGLIAAFLNFKINHPTTETALLDVGLVGVNTFILLTSSLTAVLSLEASRQADVRRLTLFLALTIILGIAFLAGQGYEFALLHSHGLTLSSSVFGSSFYTLTGFHGLHVLVGILWALRRFLKIRRVQVQAGTTLAIEVFGLYWHFVDIVWIILFTVIYLI